MAEPRRRAELADLVESLRAASIAGVAELREVPFLAQANLRVEPGSAEAFRAEAALGVALPVVPNTTATARGRDVLWLGPDEWLVVGAKGTERELEALLREAIGAGFGSVVDVSAGRTTLELSGARAREVLASACPLDVHPRAFAAGCCAQTLLARAQIVLHRPGEAPTFRILVRPSFAHYVAAWLLDAIEGPAAVRQAV